MSLISDLKIWEKEISVSQFKVGDVVLLNFDNWNDEPWQVTIKTVLDRDSYAVKCPNGKILLVKDIDLFKLN